jgi:hypothetical protein
VAGSFGISTRAIALPSRSGVGRSLGLIHLLLFQREGLRSSSIAGVLLQLEQNR